MSSSIPRAASRNALFLVCVSALIGGFAFAWTRPAARPGLVEARDTPYNSIFVHARDGLLVMAFGHDEKRYTEAVFDRENPKRLVVPYTRMMTLPVVYAPAAGSVLEIGVGGGQTLAYLHRHMPDLVATGVELDPVVIELARKHFGLPDTDRLRIHVEDGRRFLMRTQERFDVVMVDAYRGSFVPFHLTTREFYLAVKARLAPGGAVAQNISPDTMLFDSAVATLRSVFDNLDLYAAAGNVVAVAYDGPPRADAALRARAESLQRSHGFVHALPGLLAGRRVLARVPDAAPLTDDFAPVETLHAIERHNRTLDGLAKPPDDAAGTSG